MIYKKIPIEPYRCTLHYYEGESMKEMAKAVKKRHKIKLKGIGTYSGLCMSKGREFLILIQTTKNLIIRDSIIIHEVTHLVNGVFEFIGHAPDYANDEPIAYLMQNMYLKIKE